jgi:hypothetical protein
MSRRRKTILALLAVFVLVPSCTKISPPLPQTGTALADEALPAGGAIPQEWGTLVSVSTAAVYPSLVQLWFQDREGNVRMVVLDLTTHQFTNAKLIRRGQGA